MSRLRLAGWPGRLLLAPSVFIFFGIAGRHVLHPLQAAEAQGIAFDAPVGETVFRAGLGGFPLACALYLLFCLCSRRRVQVGLGFAELVVCTCSPCASAPCSPTAPSGRA